MIITMIVMMEICTSVNSDKGTVVRRITGKIFRELVETLWFILIIM